MGAQRVQTVSSHSLHSLHSSANWPPLNECRLHSQFVLGVSVLTERIHSHHGQNGRRRQKERQPAPLRLLRYWSMKRRKLTHTFDVADFRHNAKWEKYSPRWRPSFGMVPLQSKRCGETVPRQKEVTIAPSLRDVKQAFDASSIWFQSSLSLWEVCMV